MSAVTKEDWLQMQAQSELAEVGQRPQKALGTPVSPMGPGSSAEVDFKAPLSGRSGLAWVMAPDHEEKEKVLSFDHFQTCCLSACGLAGGQTLEPSAVIKTPRLSLNARKADTLGLPLSCGCRREGTTMTAATEAGRTGGPGSADQGAYWAEALRCSRPLLPNSQGLLSPSPTRADPRLHKWKDPSLGWRGPLRARGQF